MRNLLHYPARKKRIEKPLFPQEQTMSKTSYARRKAHRALGRDVAAGKTDEATAAAWKATEEKRKAKLTPKK
jgi:hypothetical protein